MTLAEMDAEVERIKSTLGPTKSKQALGALVGVRAFAKSGPDVAEALTNAIIVHAMGQPDPRGCIESVTEMLTAGVELFLFLRDEAAAKGRS